MKDSLKITVNDDNSITIDWDETDPKYFFLNDLTEEEFTQLLSHQIQKQMTDFNYKEYSLNNLRNWISDSLSSGDATAKEIYETILSEVEDYTNCYKKQYENALELQNLMKGHRPVSFEPEVWESKVEEDIITGEQWITFPPELMNKLGWKEGDDLEWIDNYDGTFMIRKV